MAPKISCRGGRCISGYGAGWMGCAVGTLIWALMFVNVVGLGPGAGILAITMSDLGMLAKLDADAIENIERPPVEGIRAAGGNWVQVRRFGVVPQVFPVMLSHLLYYGLRFVHQPVRKL